MGTDAPTSLVDPSACSYLGYEDLEVVEANPEGTVDNARTWAAGHEEVSRLPSTSRARAAGRRPVQQQPGIRLRCSGSADPRSPCALALPDTPGAKSLVAEVEGLHRQGHHVADVSSCLHHGALGEGGGWEC